MSVLRSQVAVWMIGCLLSLWLSSCSESKISQCNKLVAIINNTVSEVDATTESAIPDGDAELLKTANSVEHHAQEMQALAITDKQLDTLQAHFVQLYKGMGRANRDLVTSPKRSLKAVRDALNRLDALHEQEGQLVSELNTYCSGSS